MRDQIVFYVNGERRTARDEAGLTLSDYLRGGSDRLVGTKIACAEGDCGACTVLVGRPVGDRLEYETIDACIAFVYQMDRRHVVTVEGLALKGGPGEPPKLTAVQSAMVDCHGSQCGFCTPGFVMAMHGVLEESRSLGGASPDVEAWRLGLSGNLCRCTGYSQILDACAKCDPQEVAAIDRRFDPAPILADFVKLGDVPVHVNRPPDAGVNGHAPTGPEVMVPRTVDQLLAFRAERPDAKVVAGATDVGVQYNHGKIEPTRIIATAGVEGLDTVEVIDGELRIGAAASWSRIAARVRELVPEYHAILQRFGSPQVRHAGTLVGNLANASPIADSIPLHYVTETVLELASVEGRREAPIESFYLGYKRLDLRENEVIVGVRTPLPTESTRLKLYKVSKRRDMDISTVTAAFWLDVNDDGAVVTARVAVGGVGPTVVRLPQAEAALAGQPLTLETMRAAGRIALGEISPISDVRGAAAHRLRLVENLFAKCFYDLGPEPVAA